ncbi:hypothetical protein HMPREF0519_1644 [Lentilactobacillus hilgardii DSM 20176 = ATCC 8290]|uniref:Uncharacterized protein n=1 Tax=Lentilactobacillus hilgardii (strain ATCC 8290 / DSM 20176 / CCUG 30140 / JCM 1155 / KCTC 3500 / NBRC 15886 / NCIMB 8040 / NRRL B-1843 / 9) TaxID=1423757 RepID=C0XK83_LENH9|nr:hypothetical protein HMPREF0519_1644 [Lentilactobacillus hilgardii DSM 20176 = ATCC 8290]
MMINPLFALSKKQEIILAIFSILNDFLLFSYTILFNPKFFFFK